MQPLHILLFGVAIVCAYIALACFLIFLSITLSYFSDLEEEQDDRLANWRIVVPILLVGIAAWMGLSSVMYYSDRHAPFLVLWFIGWHAIGVASRLAFLYWKHEIFSPYFATDWEAIFFTIFWGAAGPTVLFYLLWKLIKRENPLEWLKRVFKDLPPDSEERKPPNAPP